MKKSLRPRLRKNISEVPSSIERPAAESRLWLQPNNATIRQTKFKSKRRKTERYSSPNPGGLAYQPDDGEDVMCILVHEATYRAQAKVVSIM